MEVLRFDFNGTSGKFKRTANGFLRVSARLSKIGIFDYQTAREYRSIQEAFRTDSIEFLCGAPVTDRHPSESSDRAFLTPSNAKSHMIGESLKRLSAMVTTSKARSLFIMKKPSRPLNAVSSRKSLGYRYEIDPMPGSHNGESYDAIQKNIVINHVAESLTQKSLASLKNYFPLKILE